MPTNYEQFQLLALEQQVELVWAQGIFLTARQEEGNAIDLYHMDGGFFSEVYCDKDNNIFRIQCLTNGKTLEKHTHSTSLGTLPK